ncbi:glycosyl hydrolase family 95 catalytic domain-containing protein [Streptomyces sp. NPDC055709]
MSGVSRRALLSSAVALASASAATSFGHVRTSVAAEGPSRARVAALALDDTVDWKKFLGESSMVWATVPTTLYQAPFLGNGGLGAAVYQTGSAKRLDFELGDSRVRDHQGTGGTLFGNARLRIGKLTLNTAGDVTSVDLRLSLWDAELSGTVTTTAGVLWVRAYVHASRDVLAVAVTVLSGSEQVAWTFTPAVARSPRLDFNPPPTGLLDNPAPVISGTSCVQDLAAGGQTTTAWNLRTEPDGRTKTLLATVAHTYPAATASTVAAATLSSAGAKSFAQLTTEHRAWWHAFYPKSFLTVPDTRLQSFYWIQLYKMASATRRDRPVLSTTGPWLISTPWPATWWNLNVQLEYWLINATGHVELDSLTYSLDTHRANLTANTPAAYQHDSIIIARSSHEDLRSGSPAMPGATTGTTEVGNLVWALHNTWLTYRHTMDEDLLRDTVFPLLRKAINLYLHFLTKDASGVYHLPTTYSPEYGSSKDCNYDLALIHWGCSTLLSTSRRLGLDDPLANTWQDILDHLVQPPQDATGLRIGADLQLTSGHRHYSHLLWFYPLHQLPVTTPANRTLLTTSLNHWLSFTSGLQGYTFTGSGSMYAMLGNGDQARTQLNTLLTKYVKPNTMYAETGPVIETPLSAAQTMHDMVVQSWGDTIRVFPGTPGAWADVTVHDLRTEGAFLLSAARRGGVTRFIRIKTLAGEPCKVAPGNLPKPYAVDALSGAVAWTANSDGTLSLSLTQGAEAVIYTSGTTPDLTIAPVGNATTAYWGLPATATATRVNLTSLFTVQGVSTAPGGGSFDSSGYTYPADEMPGSGFFISGRIPWTFPPTADGTRNALTANGQKITVTAAAYKALHVLGAGVNGNKTGTVTLTYSNGTTATAALSLTNWASPAAYGEKTAVYASYRHGPTADQSLPVRVFHQTLPVDPTRTLTSVTLPVNSQMRIMAITAEAAA